jgi:hypothetical protein
MSVRSFVAIVIVFLLLLLSTVGLAQPSSNATSRPTLAVDILSGETLNGTAGDYVKVAAQIQNVSSSPISDITTYLSLADEETKLPVDLEDWSAEKGLFIGTIDAGQTLPLEWKIHFVKPGGYSLIIIAETAGDSIPQVSSIVHFAVAAKHNLNPGQVLPVALCTPVVLLIIMILATYKRNSGLTR